MRKRGGAYLTNTQDKLTVAATMLAHRLTGASIRDLQEAFGCSRATVHRRLALARESGLLDTARDILMERLVPKALAAYDVALEQGEMTAAKDVLTGAGVLTKE